MDEAACIIPDCPCHTPEKPAQEKHIGDANKMVGAEENTTAGVSGNFGPIPWNGNRISAEIKKPGQETTYDKISRLTDKMAQSFAETKKPAREECCELCDMWTKDGTNHYCANSRCTCHETNKPPIYEHWEAEFDQYWQADGLGGTYVQLAFMKRFIRNLLEAEKGASVEFIAVHKDDWMKEGATSERARIKKVSENLVLHRLPMYEQEMYFQGYTPYGAYRLAIDDIKAVLEWKLKIVE